MPAEAASSETQLQVSPGLAHPQLPTLSLGSADTNSEPVTRRETGLPDGGEQSAGLDTPGGQRALGSLPGKTALLSLSTLGKLQQLRLPCPGCSSDDRALWRVCVWMRAGVRASPRAPELQGLRRGTGMCRQEEKASQPRRWRVRPGRLYPPSSRSPAASHSRSALLLVRAPAPPRSPKTRALPGSPPLRAPAPEPPVAGHAHSLLLPQASAATMAQTLNPCPSPP